jgi:hypothetical protein
MAGIAETYMKEIFTIPFWRIWPATDEIAEGYFKIACRTGAGIWHVLRSR